ncbi:hypothetical protein C0992_005717 [Termitomyces sp. T32_za158]|nr:hypothetical protein C0992_005717 [Termitomyces sp. T32_za158]
MTTPSPPDPSSRPVTPPLISNDIPPFSPYCLDENARPVLPSQDPDSDNKAPLSSARQPKGQQLVIRGCVSQVPSETPSTMVKSLLDSLGNEPQYRYFKKIIFLVSPFNDRPSNVSSACYVEIIKLDGESPQNAEPRVDLLYRIASAIAEAKPEWEVRWSARRRGRSDKRLSCHLLGLYSGSVRGSSIVEGQADAPTTQAYHREGSERQGARRRALAGKEQAADEGRSKRAKAEGKVVTEEVTVTLMCRPGSDAIVRTGECSMPQFSIYTTSASVMTTP